MKRAQNKRTQNDDETWIKIDLTLDKFYIFFRAYYFISIVMQNPTLGGDVRESREIVEILDANNKKIRPEFTGNAILRQRLVQSFVDLMSPKEQLQSLISHNIRV